MDTASANVANSMEVATMRQDSPSPECSFFGLKRNVCFASISLINVDSDKKQRFCYNEDFYNCPMYLSKLLRIA